MATAITDGPVFITRYAVGRAQSTVWFPLIVSAILGMAGLFLNQLPLTAFSAFITLAAIRHWPLTDTQRPVLRLTADGFDVDGAGRIVWASVDTVAVKQVKSGKAAPRYIEINLTEPLEIAAIPMPSMQRRPWEIKPWRRAGAQRMILQLHNFTDQADDIVGAFRHFLGARVSDGDAASS